VELQLLRLSKGKEDRLEENIRSEGGCAERYTWSETGTLVQEARLKVSGLWGYKQDVL
jgi:hypothetical protein